MESLLIMSATLWWTLLSSRKSKKRDFAPMPSASAGLLRFFEEETKGIKVRPEHVVALAAALTLTVILARIFFGPI